MEELVELMAFYTTYSAFVSLVSIAFYVLQSLGMYTIAQRRGISNPWLAWLPVGNAWILGAIADDYQLKVFGRVKSRRKLLLGMNIGVVAVVPLFLCMIPLAMAGEEGLAAFLVLYVLLLLALIVVAVVVAVFTYICLYELFASCDPNNKTLFLLLSIFLGNLSAVFVFICRNKDLGMAPPAPRSYYQPPQYLPPQQPGYQPQYQPPQYQPPQYQPPQYQTPQYQPPQYQPPQQPQYPPQYPPQQPPYNGQ